MQIDDQLGVAGNPLIPVQRMKVPERRIDSMVERLALPLGKKIRQQSILDIISKCAQNRARLAVAAGAEGEPFQTDHGIAAPIGEPMVAGNDRARFITGSPRKGLIIQARPWERQ